MEIILLVIAVGILIIGMLLHLQLNELKIARDFWSEHFRFEKRSQQWQEDCFNKVHRFKRLRDMTPKEIDEFLDKLL